MIHAVILRSPSKNGRLAGIKCPKMPNSYTLITAKDIPGVNEPDDFHIPILIDDLISYKGEPAGIISGPDLIKLENFAANCTVEVKDQIPDSVSGTEPEAFAKIIYNTNEQNESSNALLIASGSYTTGIQEHWYSETHGAIAQFTNGNLTLQTATQWPMNVKRSLARF